MEDKVNLSEHQLLSQDNEDQENDKQRQRKECREQWIYELLRMEFTFHAAQSAVLEIGTMNLEDVVDFLCNEMRTWQHPFLRKCPLSKRKPCS